MAQLPPKIPTCSTFPHQKIPSMGALAPPIATQNPSWVDEFLDFSSAKRGLHRRSVSDSIAFLETPILTEDCRSSIGHGCTNEFDRFDDEQFINMFSDEVSPGLAPTLSTASNPSTPSDHNSINEEKPRPSNNQQERNEHEEVQSSCKLEMNALEGPSQTMIMAPTELIADPKRVRRILANRQSAQRSRVRKLQYISDLERSITSLQTEVSMLSPRVAFLDHQRLLLNVDNSALKQRIAALAQDKVFKDAHQEALKREIERLRQVYSRQQSLNNMENAKTSSSPEPRASSEVKDSIEKEQCLKA
ncbi:basic leucine zipper 61-like [Malania oleifera]|uniref:basic leucine zipper 61-like n=1 Tax=Malania oleifera TaxID=397392 RepID=UPI0025AE793D|nr:basic leucine zipper 61-like [Malania oleifera]